MKNFKDGQKVKHPKYGEGVIRKAPIFPNSYLIEFEEFETQPMQIGNELYNQLEPVEDLPNVGEYCYLYYKGETYANYSKFKGKDVLGQYVNEFNQPFDSISKTPPFK